MKQTLTTFRTLILPSILNSYSVIFFFNNRIFSLVLLAVSFFNFFAGLSGFIAVLVSVFLANTMGLNKSQLKQGLFSFNALLTGIGMGTFFDPSWVFFSLLVLASLFTLILSVTFGGWLNKYGLPVLSIPFVITFWFIVLPSSQFENLGLTQRNIYWMNEVYSVGGNQLLQFFQTVDSLPIHNLVSIYLRSMSSLFFQDNLIAGLLIAITLLMCSRISFSLSIVGFLSAYFFAQFTGSETASITYYNIGANYIMVAIAIGSFFIIPSRYSYLWTVLLVPLTSLVLLFMNKLFGFIQLPVFSLPFSVVVILFVYFLHLRTNPSKLIITPIQYYSPEINLYNFKNNKARLSHSIHFPLYLPFWGEWTVSQGYNGKYTHKGDWGKALDFEIMNGDGKSYTSNGLLCDNYYCYNKPVLAPADGIVEAIYDNVDDNEIGKVNTTNNWGNTIIIRHLPGLYTQLSHLKKGTFKVSIGEQIHRGQILANCGNSGRSPEPHLHFQVQISSILGSKTIEYPLAYYRLQDNTENSLQQFTIPNEGKTVSGIIDNNILKNAFGIMPNTSLSFSYFDKNGERQTEKWESFTDAYNQKYLYCKETDSSAFYINDNTMFYFTTFYGDKNSLLYYFYLSAYKVFLGDLENETLKDAMPLNLIRRNKLSLWLHDFIAPFYQFIHLTYVSGVASKDNAFDTNELIIESEIELAVLGNKNTEGAASIKISKNRIESFQFKSNKINVQATCIES